MTDEDAVAIVQARSGTMYDPRVVDAFMALLPELRAADHEAEGPPASSAGETAIDATGCTRTRRDRVRGDASALGEPPRCRDGGHGSRMRCLPPRCACSRLTREPTCWVWRMPLRRLRKVVSTLNIRTGDGLAGWVAANRHTIANSDASLDLGDAATDTRPRRLHRDAGVRLRRACRRSVRLSPGKLPKTGCETIGALAQEIGLEIARHEQRLSAGRAPAPNTGGNTRGETHGLIPAARAQFFNIASTLRPNCPEGAAGTCPARNRVSGIQ